MPDIILITGDYHIDHPLNATGILKRVLEGRGFSVDIISKPDWKSDRDFQKHGKPGLFFGITSGSMDSLLQNYTPLKKLRAEDPHHPYNSNVPDRAVIVYANKIRELYKGVPIVIGGVEASLRRFTHYDYLDNKARRSILLDSRADILVYGAGEYAILEIAERLKRGADLPGIESTCIVSNNVPQGFTLLPSHEEAVADKEAFCRMQLLFTNAKLAQPVQNRFILQNKMHDQTTAELDQIFDLPYSRKIPKEAHDFQAVQFSVISHRGCFGRCNFCSIALHFGDRIISRSEKSILSEIEKIAAHPDFKGYIDDLGGPSANMYGMDCVKHIKCKSHCLACKNLNRDHKKLIHLLNESRKIQGIKKVFVRSGIRYDLALESPEYIEVLSKNHISGCLKIAPEHFSTRVLKLMNKDNSRFPEFLKIFARLNQPLKQALRYYFITAHPGSEPKDVELLIRELKKLWNVESIQVFTPTPMSVSTCMYYTELNPFTLEPVYVPKSFTDKKWQKKRIFEVLGLKSSV
ncbi:MAG: YgiQ family radical SAM protein [Candidatus Wallbacteria bacterium]|nr:YgiQ family radical SAM protein [Candidatus Wallbacteria bacterium]